MLIEGKDLTLVYDRGKDVETCALKNVNISVDKNQLVGILGPSGSGKSSLLYILAGMKVPQSGTVLYKGTNINQLEDASKFELRRREFGFVFQKHFLIDYLTVLDNTLVSVNRFDASSRESALLLLDKLGIKHLANRKPAQLSGGQRQRVAIARSMMNQPQVIFADEPTASLDHISALEAMSIMKECNNNASIVIVTHDASVLQNADQVVELWDGQIRRQRNNEK